jgi:[acyl-carrier-protein] S-malonyltransferase
VNAHTSQANLGFVFPGQGSQAVGMLSDLANETKEVGLRFEAASRVLGFDLWDLVRNGPEDRLNRTENTQPALLAASVATWDVWIAQGGPRPARVAGHSFGEYTALVVAGVLEYEAAVALVADRGRFIQDAVPEGEGAMAAILGLDLAALEEICRQAAEQHGTCACANLNAPGQIAIAGRKAAVDIACKLAIASGAKRAIPLAVSAPIHCDLMQPAAVRLEQRLGRVVLKPPQIEVIHNVDASPHTDPRAIKTALIRQLYSPVRWIETIENFAESGITTVCECGPGKILSALIKRIDRSINCTPLANTAAIRDCLAAYTERSA